MQSLTKTMARFSRIFAVTLLAIFFVVLSKSICESSLLTRPRSAIARVGDKVEFNCSVNQDQPVIWGFTSSNTSKDTDFYFGGIITLPFESRYRIENKIRGQHNLIIDSVDMDHAGRYRCVTFGTDSNAIAHLTVLDTVPECWANTSSADQGIKEHGFVWMWCRVIYTGNMIPIFTWTKNNAQDSITPNTTTSDKRTLPLTTTSSVIAQLRSDGNGAIFKCELTFNLPNNTEGNAPNDTYTWIYAANIMYGPKNLSIIRYGNHLVCSANGNPMPTYTWTYIETNRSTAGPVYELDAADAIKRTVYCTAANAIATENMYITIYATNISHATESDGKSALSTAEAAIIIASLSLAGCMLLGLIIGLRKLSSFLHTERRSSQSDSLAMALSIQMSPSSFGLQIELPTTELNSTLSSVIENQDSQTTATTVDYCSLTNQPSTAQEPQLYCELLLYEQPNKDYINQPTSD